MNSHPLIDSVILVTGAGKGIGRAFVEQFLALEPEKIRGTRLYLISRTESDLLPLKALAETKHIVTELCALDLCSDPTFPVKDCTQKFGRIDILVHSAGVGRFGGLERLTEEDLDFTLDTNVRATFLLLQKGYLQMKSQPLKNGLRGQIQVITSVAAEIPFEQSAIYCMTKYAQRGLIDVLRIHARKDSIRVLEVRPGATHTPMWGELEPKTKLRMMEGADIALPMIESLTLSSRATLECLTLRPLGGDL
jgi:sepiapterin reductase